MVRKKIVVDAFEMLRTTAVPKSTNDVARKFSVSYPTALRILKDAESRGIVKHTWKSRSAKWESRWKEEVEQEEHIRAYVHQRVQLQYAVPILNALRFRPQRAEALSSDLGIPIAATYRAIAALREIGLVVVFDRPLTQQGKRVNLYIATIAYAPNPNYARLREKKIGSSIRPVGELWDVTKVAEPTA